MKKVIILPLIVSALILGCNLIPLAAPPDFDYKGVSLVLYLGSDLGARTLQPTLDMDLASYDISITGPGTTVTATVDVSETLYTVSNLDPGVWTVTVNGLNGAGTPIATDVPKNVTVIDNQISEVNITVVPLTGTGELTLYITFPAAQVTAPVIVATLTPDGGTAQDAMDLTFVLDYSDVDNTVATCSAPDLTTGYYYLFIQLYDVSDLVYGMMETVRILSGQTTPGTWTLTGSDITAYLAGGININLYSDLQNPLDVALSGNVASLASAASMTVSTALTPSVTGETYQWYLNGVAQSGATGSTITIDNDGTYAAGNYRLDVIVDYESSLSSAYVTFAIE